MSYIYVYKGTFRHIWAVLRDPIVYVQWSEDNAYDCLSQRFHRCFQSMREWGPKWVAVYSPAVLLQNSAIYCFDSWLELYITIKDNRNKSFSSAWHQQFTIIQILKYRREIVPHRAPDSWDRSFPPRLARLGRNIMDHLALVRQDVSKGNCSWRTMKYFWSSCL